MKETVIKSTARANSSKGANKLLRRNGYLPGNISCKGEESIAIAIRRDEFIKFLHKVGSNSVFKLEIPDGRTYTVMVKEVQFSTVKNEYLHVEFQQVSLSQEVHVEVSIKLHGIEILESKRLVINRHMDSIPIKGLPQDIPNEIVIDLSYKKAGDTVLFSNIKLPNGVSSDIAPDHLIVSVSESKGQVMNEVEDIEDDNKEAKKE